MQEIIQQCYGRMGLLEDQDTIYSKSAGKGLPGIQLVNVVYSDHMILMPYPWAQISKMKI